MSYGGTVRQDWCERLAPHLSKNNNGGLVLAEQMFRNEYTHEALVALFSGEKIEAGSGLARRLPISVITGATLTGKDV